MFHANKFVSMAQANKFASMRQANKLARLVLIMYLDANVEGVSSAC